MNTRQLNTDEVIAVTTWNCSANAILDNLPNVERRFRENGQADMIEQIKGAVKIIAGAVQHLIEYGNDPDQQIMIQNRMSRLKLQYGYVRKHPESLVIMTRDDAETLLAPVLEKCDLECPCVELDKDGHTICIPAMVKACETRKALKRTGISEAGLSMDCPYQFITGSGK